MQKTWIVILLIAVAAPAARAQINCASGSSASGKLSCLVPTFVTSIAPSGYNISNSSSSTIANFQNFQNNFAFLTADMGGEISQIPLASPASGIIFAIDPTLKVPVPSDQSLGPILTQRADTIGRHKMYVASTYQYFLFKDVDGLSLQNLPSAFLMTCPSCTGADANALAVVNGRLDLKIHQFVGYVTYGLTNRIDVSAAVPLLRVDMRYTVNERVYNSAAVALSQSPAAPNDSKSGEATGIGDIILAYKEEFWKGKHGGLAFGTEVRLPTGDAENFLGSGAFGVKPYVTLTRSGKISPHLNVGYQFNGRTELVTNSAGRKVKLPERVVYSGGLDWGIARRLTVAADVLEQRVLDGPRAIANPATTPFANSNLTLIGAISSANGSYNRTDGSIGIKLKPFGNMLVTGNLLVKLDRNGLRQRMAPLMGLSFTY